MSDIKEQIKIDTKAYVSEVNEHSDSKDGYFVFDSTSLVVTIGFTSDEYGNVESLRVIDAQDDKGNDTTYMIDDSNYQEIANQIEPKIWNDTEFLN